MTNQRAWCHFRSHLLIILILFLVHDVCSMLGSKRALTEKTDGKTLWLHDIELLTEPINNKWNFWDKCFHSSIFLDDWGSVPHRLHWGDYWHPHLLQPCLRGEPQQGLEAVAATSQQDQGRCRVHGAVLQDAGCGGHQVWPLYLQWPPELHWWHLGPLPWRQHLLPVWVHAYLMFLPLLDAQPCCYKTKMKHVKTYVQNATSFIYILQPNKENKSFVFWKANLTLIHFKDIIDFLCTYLVTNLNTNIMYSRIFHGLFYILFIFKVKNLVCKDMGTLQLGTSAVIYCVVRT